MPVPLPAGQRRFNLGCQRGTSPGNPRRRGSRIGSRQVRRAVSAGRRPARGPAGCVGESGIAVDRFIGPGQGVPIGGGRRVVIESSAPRQHGSMCGHRPDRGRAAVRGRIARASVETLSMLRRREAGHRPDAHHVRTQTWGGCPVHGSSGTSVLPSARSGRPRAGMGRAALAPGRAGGRQLTMRTAAAQSGTPAQAARRFAECAADSGRLAKTGLGVKLSACSSPSVLERLPR
jgi:hypothetical protein